MKLPKLAIQNYNFTVVVFVILLIGGMISFFNMPRTENPSVDVPGGSVVVIYPGVSPVDLEQLVAIPIEEAINEIEDIKFVNTHIYDGLVSVSIRFTYDTDANEKYTDLVTKINSIKSSLPSDIFDLIVTQWTVTDVNVLQLALVSETASYEKLDEWSGKLKKDIEKAHGIMRSEVHAIPEQELLISVDMEKMAMMNISLDQLINSIKSYNANIPGGAINLQGKTFNIKTSGAYKSLEDIKNTVINSYKGKIIYLKNIASVEIIDEELKYYGRFNGKKAVFIAANQKAGYNIFKTMDDINPIINRFEQSLDDEMQLFKVFDQSIGVEKRINGFLSNLTQGIILVGILILLAIGFKSSIIIIIAIPLSIMIGLLFVDYSGYGMQQISIAGLVIALGLLVDNSIVMIENITRYIKLGYKPKEAAAMGASEIGWPIISATLTTLLAFIPIIMMPNEAGEFIRSLPVTIIATLTVSLAIALTLSPLIASLVLKDKDFKNHIKEKKFNFPEKMTVFIEGPYRKVLLYSLNHKFLVLSVALVIFVISIFVAVFYIPKSLFPKAETPQMIIQIKLPEGSNLDKTNKAALFIESVLDTIPDIKHYATNIGRGNPQIYYNIYQKNYSKNFAEIYLELYEYDIENFDLLVKKLRDIFSRFIGAEINIKEFEQGAPIAAPIEIHLTGDEMDVLRSISKDVEAYVRKSDQIINIENELDKIQTNLFFNINKDKASMLGVPIYEIDKTIRAAITGLQVSSYRDKAGDEYNIVIKMAYENDFRIKDFDKIFVKSYSGKLIPLNQLAKLEFNKSATVISRYNFDRNARILADLKKGASIDDVMAPVLQMLESYSFPTGYNYTIGGELESREDTFGGMSTAMIIAVIAILAVLILQFNSFIQPLIIFVTVPLAVIGMVWALYLTNNSFSFTAFIGLISLVGIVVNNSIILVDYTNILRKQGTSLYEAVQQAGETRFTPILLTALTTIGGLLPLTLQGGTLWAPMGWTIIGGLFVSTFLTLIIVPVIYTGLERFMQIIRKSNGNAT